MRPLNRCFQNISRPLSKRLMGTTATAAVPSNDLSTELEKEKPLYGTVASHRSYIFLHSPIPPEKFPSRMTTPLQRAMQLRALKWGGIVNFSWFEGGEHDTTVQRATAFSALGGRLNLPEVVLENVDTVDAVLRDHAEGRYPSCLPEDAHGDAEIHLYVCTHGQRDCRCGDMGGRVVRALKKEVKARGVNVGISEVGHVGGHQYAANVLVFPQGEWLGRVTPEAVPELLTAVLASPRRPFTPSDPPLLKDHWRGRTGLGKEEQVALFEGLQ